MKSVSGFRHRSVSKRRPSAPRHAGWSLALLASTALVAVPSALVPFGFGEIAAADGGKAGLGTPGGVSSATGNGGKTTNGAGSGGGAGVKGGDGDSAVIGLGGQGGSTTGADGADGKSDGSTSSSGGGGGAHGYVGSTAPTGAVSGGRGGKSGAGYYTGGGGAGGYGAVLTGSGPYTIGNNVTGGAGGSAGAAAKAGGAGGGGDGGYGLLLTSSATVSVNDGVTIIGGAGGAGGSSSSGSGPNGTGGIGISGDSLTLSLGAGATVTGGLGGDGTTRANAITFTGSGANVLELIGNGGTSGQTYATITGDVVGAPGFATNTLKFSGNGGVFDLSKFEAADTTSVQFRKFDTVSVASGLWIMSGSQANSNAVAGYRVDGGTLQLGSAGTAASIVGTVKVNNGGTLTVGAAGATVSNAVKVYSGGTLDLAAVSGRSALTLSGDKLELNSGGTFKVTLGAPTTTALVMVTNDNLNVDGALVIASNGNLGEGTYSLVKYGGSGTGNFASISGPSDYTYSTSIDSTNKVLLLTVVSAGLYWNGTTITGAGPLDGGTGIWTAASGGVQNWSNSGGTTHVVTDPTKKAVFAGSAGTVTVDASQGAVASSGLKFTTSGYVIAGAALTLATTSGAPQIEVVGSGTSATIGSPLDGTQGLEKIGVGILVLTGANTYTGGTTITAGTLQIGNGGTTGAVTGDIVDNAALVFDRSDAVTYAGVISGTGTLEKAGAGTLTLTGSHTYSGDTTVSGGTLAFAGGSSATSGGNAVIAKDASASGTVTVSGSGTAWNLGVGHMTVGEAGTGTLAISGGASVTDSDAVVANQSGSAGTVTVAGTGTSWTVNGNGLSVGGTGTGTMTVTDGAAVSVAQLRIGKAAGSTGTVTVSGAATRLQGNFTAVGDQGTGTFTIADGAKVTASSIYIGTNGGFSLPAGSRSVSTATVTGTGSNWAATSDLYLGLGDAKTNGTLVVEKGGTVSAKGLITAMGSGADGIVTVTGTGSAITLGNDGIFLGYVSGAGTLTIADGGTVTSGGDVIVGGYGGNGAATVTGSGSLLDAGTHTVQLALLSSVSGTLSVAQGGTVAAKQFVKGNASATASLGLDGGTLRATAAQSDYLKGFSAGDVVLQAGGGTIDTNGFATGIKAAIGGTGGLTKIGAGTLTLTGASTFTGTTTVTAGTLQLSGGGTLGGDLDAQSGTTFTGDPTGTTAGTVAGAVTVRGGATLVTRSGATTLSVGSLGLDGASTVSTTLFAPSSTATVGVTGNLALAGTLNLTAATGFASGTYRLFDYGGTLSGPGLSLGTVPAHNLFAVDTATANQVNLLVAAGLWWNGSTTSSGGSSVAGGAGTWDVSAGTTNWTDAGGSAANAWGQGSLAIFAGTAGTVTVGGSTVPQAAGLEFVTTGYTVTGGEIALSSFGGNPATRILVDDGTAGGGTATIASVLSGSQTLEKTGPGTLVLSAANTYGGGTRITGGTLQVGDGGTSGAILGDIADNAAVAFDRSDSVTFAGVISGSGSLEQKGTGTLVLTGANTYTGGTTITAGTLQIGNGGTSGAVTGDIANATALIFNRSDDSAYAGAISGSGTVEKTGAGTLTLTGNHTYSGDTTVSGGTLAFAGGASTINSAIVSIGKAAGTTGALSVTGSSTSVTFANTSIEQLRVGEGGNGTLSVTGGATLTSFDTFIGVDTGSVGTVTVSGRGTKWDAGSGRVEVGYAGVGTVTVSDGATVTSGRTWVGLDTAGGTVTVTGANTTWNTGGHLFDVGSFGPGTLTISDGAVVTSLFESKIGDDASATGTATVTGTGSKWDLGTADLYVGNAGKGTLHVASGGTVTSGTAYISWDAFSTGSVTVDGTGSTWAVTGGGAFTPSSLHVGYVGNGALTVSNGGTVTSPLAAIGSQLGSVGTVTVTGTGSSWTIGNGTIYGGGLTVGDAGNGSLTVAAGATVSATYLTVANGNATQGDLTVTGAGSTLSLTDQIDVGYYGTARLTIADGGKLVGASAAYVGYYGGSYLPAGSTAKVTSTATITGAGSNWDQSAGQIFLGYDAAGTVGALLVEKGGTVASKGGTIGYLNSAEGIATVTGSGSSWTVGTDGLVIGDRASGSLTVADSGTVITASEVTIGKAAGSTGTVAVTGAGSSLTVAGTGLFIAQDGTGSLTVANGGTVTSTADIIVGSDSGSIGTATVDGTGSRLVAGTNRVVLANDSGVTSTLTVTNGGSVEAGQLVKGNSGATATLALDGGTLRATAAQADYLKGFAAGDVTLAAGGGTIDTHGYDVGITTVLGGVGGLSKAGAGTLTLTGANTFSGITTVAVGTLQLSGGGALAGALEAQAGTILTGDPTGATAGSVAGAVTVRDGATLAMRSGATTLTLGSLTLGSAATVATTLLAPSATAAVGVSGNLTLAGTLDLTAGTGFASGTYRLFDYGGSLSGAGLTLGMQPVHNLYAVDTATAGQVNLIVVQSQWWNGSGTGGGSGTWDAGTTANWTDAAGSTTQTWKQGSLATFGGTAGTVTVAAATAPQAVGLEFVTSGYTLSGGPITLVPFHGAPVSRVLVDDGTAGGGSATVASALTGTQGLEKTGPGTLVLSGANTYTGDTQVTAGTLQLSGGGSLAGNVAIGAGAVLSGDPAGASAGTVAGNVAVAAGGGLHLVTGTTTLSVGGALALDPAASVSVLVLSPSATTAAHVGGNLTLAGTLDLTAGAGFGSGIYRLFDYGGTLSGAGLTLGATPAHSLFAVDTATTGQVNLVVAAGLWWNGSTTGAGGSSVAGGTGTWDVAAAPTNWTDAAGAAANAWSQGSLAIFGGTAGTVTVVGTAVPQAAGLEFVTSGYTVAGGAITLTGFHNDPVTRVLVDDGTAGGGTATVASVLSGGQTLQKTGAGTLVLTGTNTYTGGTTVTAGTLQIGAGGTTGSVVGAIANAGTVVFDRADDFTPGGAITGPGALIQRGTGTLTLAGNHSAGAGTTVAAGTLALASGAQLASDVTVQSGASLTARNTGATPTVAGIVTVQPGATLRVAPAAGGDGLSTTGLVLTAGSHLAVTLGAPTGHAAVSTGTLALDGVLDVAAGSGLMQGVYRVIDYTTLASDHGLQLGSTPTGFTYAIQRQQGQVNLAVASAASPAILYWNGPQTAANGTIQGGAGTWSSDPTQTNWTDTGATQSLAYQPAFAVLGGTGGTVRVDASKGPLSVGGMQFTAGGYTLSGDAITLADASGLTQVRVGDGTAAGAGTVATIASALAGPGGLVKTDLGTLVLSGTNTYTGDTQVKGGTLALAGSLDGDIYVYDQATLSGGGKVGKTVHVLDGGTLAGASGNGLTMAGLDLSGKATLAVTLGAPGGAGVFQVNGNVTLGGTLAVTQGVGFGFGVYRIANYTGHLTDTGMKVGALPGGALGGLQTSVAQQINLFVEDPNNPVAFWNGSTTQPTQTVAGGSGTWSADPTTNWTNASGTISRRWPSGFAVFQGPAGTATVDISAGAVTVSGIQFADTGFRVAGGALTLAGPGAIPIRVGDGTTAGAATVATIASALTGAGGLEKSDYGTLILTGTNTYAGGTRITAGTLQLGDGGTTGSVEGAIVNDARLVYARSDTYAVRGQLSGAGDLEFRGGTVQYGTNAGFTGAVTAKDAFVRLDPGAVSASAFTLESGSVLGGTATIGALTANAGSIVAPGYSPGTIAVTGAVAFNAGSTFAVDVTPDGRHDLITATGPVTLSSQAKVAVHATPGRYAANSTYAILTTTATVTGQFAGVTSDYAFLKPTLSYDAQNVYLGLTYNERRFTDFARTRNQFALAAAAQDLGFGNRIFDTLLNLPEGQVARAFDRLDGEGHASLNTVIQQQSAFLRDGVSARLRQSGSGNDALGRAAQAAGPATQSVDGDPGRVLWAQAYGGFGRRQGDGNAGAVASSTGGMLAGLDVALGDAIRVGVLGGLGRSSADVPSRDTSATFADYDVGLYGSGRFGALAVRGGFAQSWHDVSARRSVVIPGYTGSETARYTVAGRQVFGEVSTDVAVGATTLQPFAGLSSVSLDGHRVSERGSADAALSGTVRAQGVTTTSVGARAATQITLGEVVLTPSVTLGWQHAFGDLAPRASLRFAGGSAFGVSGVPVAQETALVGAGLSYDLSDVSAIRVNYTGQLAPKATQNAFTAEYAHRF